MQWSCATVKTAAQTAAVPQWERRLAGFDAATTVLPKGIISNIVSRVLYAAGHRIAQNGRPNYDWGVSVFGEGAFDFCVVGNWGSLCLCIPMGRKVFAVCSFL